MRIANEAAVKSQHSEGDSDVDARVRELEQQVKILRAGRDLPICFAFLTMVHVLAFYKLVPMSMTSAWPTWIGLSGIGTMAIWFAWTQRPIWQRIARVTVAISAAALVAPHAVPYFMRYQRTGGFVPIKMGLPVSKLGLLQGQNFVTPQDSFRTIVICWIVGAFIAAFLTTWFLGLQLRVPGIEYRRKPLSIRSILVLTFCAALASFFIRSTNWADRSLYFVNGMTLGFLAAGIAWAAFQQRMWQRIACPLAVIAVIIALDLVIGRFLNVWKGNALERFQYVAIFVGGLSVSPWLSFMLLRSYGYSMTSSRFH